LDPNTRQVRSGLGHHIPHGFEQAVRTVEAANAAASRSTPSDERDRQTAFYRR
jgi:hypothetical protein